jgi:alginate O-acetyltransferase complex protein AlgI
VIFNSVTYLVLLLLVLPVYWSLPLRGRQWLIVAASLTFYGFWKPEFILVMLASASTDFFVGLRMASSRSERTKRRWLFLSLFVNLGFLLYFKYLFFIVANGVVTLRFLGFSVEDPILNIILPLGISFYTFETISYSVDVYRGTIKPERDLLAYVCFITFFPKLIAGPILRAHQLIPQLKQPAVLTLDDAVEGARRILIGLFLKVGLADNLAPLVDEGFKQPAGSLSALDVWTLAFLFGYQIYFDFSAYSHIAIGTSRLMGIRLVENFNFPYAAASPREFWQRWHISLSGWIRDYLYLPLLGTRPGSPDGERKLIAGDAVDGARGKGPGKRRFALFATWAIMGLWHGANWTFLFWGLIHALYIFGYRATERVRVGLPMLVRRVGGFAITLPLVMLAWIAFRAPDTATMWSLYRRVLDVDGYRWLGLRENNYLIAAGLLLVLIAAPIAHQKIVRPLDSRPFPSFALNLFAVCAMAMVTFTFLRPISQFIYFAF